MGKNGFGGVAAAVLGNSFLANEGLVIKMVRNATHDRTTLRALVALAICGFLLISAPSASASEAPCDAHPDVCALILGNAPEWCTANAQAEDCAANVTEAALDMEAMVRGTGSWGVEMGCEAGGSPGCQVVEDPAGWCEEQALGVDCPSQILALLQEIEDSQGGTLSEATETLAGFGDFVDDAANRDLLSISLDSGCRSCGVTFYRRTNDPMVKGDSTGGNYNHKYENNMDFHKCYLSFVGGVKRDDTSCLGTVFLTDANDRRIAGHYAQSSGGAGHEVHAEFPRTAGRPWCKFLGTEYDNGPYYRGMLVAWCWYRYG